MALSKSTYSLDAVTLRHLDELALRWRVSKTEVLRRALRAAKDHETVHAPEAKLALLHRLQEEFAEQKVDFERWKRDTKRGRR